MNKNFKEFLIRAAIVVAVVFFSRMIFQGPIEYFKIEIFRQTVANRLFSKIDALQVLVLVCVFFGFYFKSRIGQLNHKKQPFLTSLSLVFAGEFTIAAYYVFRAATNYYSITEGIYLWLLQGLILLSLATAFLLFSAAVFSKDYLRSFYKEFKKELFLSAAAGFILYNAMVFFQKQWLFFSTGVLKVLVVILSLFYQVRYSLSAAGGPILKVSDFAVAIGPPCSGIESMFLFTAFFAGLFALDHKRINKARYFILFTIGLLGVYAVNILRLFLLMLAGIHISPKFAVGLFHTNAGWLLFVIYFLTYYLIIRKFIYQKEQKKEK